MDYVASFGLRIAAAAISPLIKRLFQQPGPGAGLVGSPVRLSSLVAFGGEKRALGRDELRELTTQLVSRAERATGPGDRFDADERPAVIDAVTRTLGALGELDMDDVQAVGLGPERFARRLREQAADACRELSRDGTHFHDRLVDTASLHILHFFTQQSTFIPRTLVETSRRLDEAMGVLRQLTVADTEFEADYLRSLVRLHDQLTIVGVDFTNAPDTWSLRETYLSLGVEVPSLPSPTGDGSGGDGSETLSGNGGDDASRPPVTVPGDQALAESDRILLRGIAGSGKTTLAQWLTVSTAARRLPADLRRRIGDRVPFMLPVRRFAHEDYLPAARFLAAALHPLAGSEPDGWTMRVLRAGRGLLLIDGIDEAPAERREAIRRQLRGLLASFPGNYWLVTSRPSAVRKDWLSDQGFTELTLAPMNREQVAHFISMWHASSARDSGRDHALLPGYEERLQHAVRIVRELRRLAPNPLMCGLICALNRDRNGILPRGRKELYEAALAMLLERRDPERDVDADGIVLDREAKQRLLQKLAHWMLLNDRSEIQRATALDVLDSYLPYIPAAGEQGRAKQLFEHLVHRTGLLLMPTADSVYFVHRTFQDYLSAKEAVERHDFPFLLANAHHPDWDEVIRMAVSLARPDECAMLVETLAGARPGLPAAKARYCKLLAASCVQHATEMHPEAREKVRQRTRYLVPPKSLPAARGLGWVGPIVLELLPDPERVPDKEAMLLAATATGVRDDAAIDYLARLRGRRSLAVREELAGAWRRFDTDRYAAEIISHLDPDGLYFTVTDLGEMAALRALGGRERVRAAERLSPEELTSGLPGERLTHLYLLAYDAGESLSWLAAFPRLEVLRLGRHVPAVHGVPDGIRLERDGGRAS